MTIIEPFFVMENLNMIVDHLGHWSVLETPLIGKDIDLSKYIGFVYVMSFDDGTKYVGAKKIWKRIAKPPCEFKRGPRKGYEQSDWRDYTSSSNEVNWKIEQGILPSEYLIVGFYDSWGKTLYAEARLQIDVNIFSEDSIWLNAQIEGHFTRSCNDDSIKINNDAYLYHLSGVKYGTFKNDILMDVEINGELIKNSNIADLIPYNSFLRLIDGRIDEYNGVSLPSELKRVDWKYKYNNKTYINQKELLEDLGISKSEMKDYDIEEGVIETRGAYIKRLKDVKYILKRRYT